ncbi:MAG TPA: nuclear transport factor 2 family protein [Candidatus Acidoferrum sp.]|nr:nuclear transport factor 2 family protein [Candidatus Acidoferrum sp.]
MRPLIRSPLLVCISFALFSLGLLHSVAAKTQKTQKDGQLADHAFTAAIIDRDQRMVAQWLDPDFTWTDRTGKTHPKAEVLSSLASLTREPDDDVQILDAGQAILIRGSHRLPSHHASVRFARIWVKRPEAWHLLIYQETNKAERNPEERSGFGAPSNGAPVACENPCQTIPYKAENPAEQEVASMWQAVERAVLTNDVAAWAPNFTDDFLFVTPDGGPPLNKADRIAMITELRRTSTTLIPAEVTSMKIWVFGDAAVMRSEHKPLRGKVLHVTRLFEKHNGHWQIAFGQQTWVE